MKLIQVTGLKKSFVNGDQVTEVLKGIDLVVEDREFIAVVGRSGAGKSTLMYQVSLLDDPTSGDVRFWDKETRILSVGGEMSQEEKTVFRLNELGYVFQDYALLPDLSALENVAVPLMMQGKSKLEAHTEARASLERVELGHRLNNLPSQLSGGEQQRVSIARALAHNPHILFADEPTANLDNESSRSIIKLFQDLNAQGQTIIMVTHEEEYAELATRVIRMDDGRIVSDVKD